MTIQPDNHAPKFQDSAETPSKTPEKNKVVPPEDGRKSPAVKKSSEERAPAAAEKKSPEERVPAGKKSPEERAPAGNQAAAAKESPENQAPVAARTRLFEDQDVARFREQWRELQAGFVDEPRGAVREADTLVSQMMDRLTSQLAEQKRVLQGESDAVDTEQLRVALQRYRSLFDQMLQV
jgi:predicted lipid-binding transport protein (Tim44 family)